MSARERLAVFLTVFISAVYGAVALASIITKEYTALTIMTPMELLIVGYAVGLKPGDVVKRNGSNGEEKKP